MNLNGKIKTVVIVKRVLEIMGERREIAGSSLMANI